LLCRDWLSLGESGNFLRSEVIEVSDQTLTIIFEHGGSHER
jgi:hypothetical protein